MLFFERFSLKQDISIHLMFFKQTLVPFTQIHQSHLNFDGFSFEKFKTKVVQSKNLEHRMKNFRRENNHTTMIATVWDSQLMPKKVINYLERAIA